MTAAELAEKLGGKRSGNHWACRCPAHDDRKASLSVRDGDRGVVVKCHAGCTFKAICAAAPVDPKELSSNGSSARPTIAATYDYRDEKGVLRFQVVRLDPKDFRQRKPDGQGWIWSTEGVTKFLYRLPELISADPEEPVFIVEGERDVATLVDAGLVATTWPGGAKAWKDHYAKPLAGRDVFIIGDNDPDGVGMLVADKIARACKPIATRVRLIAAPAPYKDITDYLAHHTRDELHAIVAATGAWGPSQQKPAASKHGIPAPKLITVSGVARERVEWLWKPRIPVGKITMLDGDPGLGKSVLTLDIAGRVSTGQPFPESIDFRPPGDVVPRLPGGVVLLQAEDDVADTTRPRLEGAKADLKLIHTLTDGISLPSGIPALEAMIASLDPAVALLAVDPLEAFLDPDINPNSGPDIRRALQPLARLAALRRLAVLIIRHLNKRADAQALYRGAGSIGIIGVARAGLLVAEDPNDPRTRVLAPTKANLAIKAHALRFRVEPAEHDADIPVIHWLSGKSDLTADDLTAGHNGHRRHSSAADDRGPTKVDKAREWLREFLSLRSVWSKDIYTRARAAGFSDRTIDRAKETSPIDSFRVWRKQGPWLWTWCADEAAENEPAAAENAGQVDRQLVLR